MKNNWFPLPTSYSKWQQPQVELKPKETQTQLDVKAQARSEFETYLFPRSVSQAKHGSLLTTLQTQFSLDREQHLNLIYFYFLKWHVTAR